jgi:leader peptidase (prepilin peptidase)/N-methyltransferase
MNIISDLVHTWLILPASFLLGLIVGSFLNVCIYRLPAKQSIVFPASSCPNCKEPIKAYDNIPLLSYFLLKGRCRYCGESISWQYPAVELATGLLFLGLAYKWGFDLKTLIYAILICALIIVSVIDIYYQIIPDKITLPGIGLGLLMAFLSLLTINWVHALLGLSVGGGILYVAAFLSRGGMGGGDIKLAALIGVFLGWENMLLTIFASVLLGSLAGVTLMLFKGKGRKDKIPFGPFLALGALISIFWGKEIIAWYLHVAYLL